MSNFSNFELEPAIQRWRSELHQLPAFRGADIDELEGHLRDAIAALRFKSLTEEEAFWVAQRRLGTPERLEREFRPVNTGHLWQQRGLWMVAGFLIISSFTSLTGSVVHLIVLAGYQLGVPTVFVSWLSPILQIAGLGTWVFLAQQILQRSTQSGILTGQWTPSWKHGLLLLGIIVGANVISYLSMIAAFRFTEPQVYAALLGRLQILSVLSILFWPVLFIWMLHRSRPAIAPNTSS